MARQILLKNVSDAELMAAYEKLGLSFDDRFELRDMLLALTEDRFQPFIRPEEPSTALTIINELVVNLKASGGFVALIACMQKGKAPTVSEITDEDYFYLRQNVDFSIRENRQGNPKQRELAEKTIVELTPGILLHAVEDIAGFGKKTAAQFLAIRLLYDTIQQISPHAPLNRTAQQPEKTTGQQHVLGS